MDWMWCFKKSRCAASSALGQLGKRVHPTSAKEVDGSDHLHDPAETIQDMERAETSPWHVTMIRQRKGGPMRAFAGYFGGGCKTLYVFSSFQ